MMDGTNWGWVVAGGALVWNVIATIYAWYSSSQSVTKKEIDALVQSHAGTNERLSAVERDLRAMPSTDAFHKLELVVTEMRGGMNTLAAKFEPTAVSVKRIEQYLLETNMKKVTR